MEEYIVSARKYRPMTFDTVVGQSALTTTFLYKTKMISLAKVTKTRDFAFSS